MSSDPPYLRKPIVPSAGTVFGGFLLIASVGLAVVACGMTFLFHVLSPRPHLLPGDYTAFLIFVVAPYVGAMLSLPAGVLLVGKGLGNSPGTWISAGVAALLVVPILLLTAILAYPFLQ